MGEDERKLLVEASHKVTEGEVEVVAVYKVVESYTADNSSPSNPESETHEVFPTLWMRSLTVTHIEDACRRRDMLRKGV